MPQPSSDPALSTLHGLAVRAGHYVWLERRLFELLGGWVASVPEPDVQELLSTHSFHHAWHAQLWEERLPVLHDRPADDPLVAPPDEDVAAALADVLASASGRGHTIEKLVGAYRVVYPHLLAAYAGHRAVVGDVADRPVRRALDLVRRDLAEDRAEGEALLLARLVTADDARRAAEHQARTEAAIVAAGGLLGRRP